jgi:hypothetical protein
LMFDGRVPHGPERLTLLPARFLSITVDLDLEEREAARTFAVEPAGDHPVPEDH